MSEQLRVNIRVGLAFYRRNNLLILATVVILLAWGLTALPGLLFINKTAKFTLIQSLFSQLNSVAILLSAALGLLNVSAHLRNRSLKMVLTKPCPHETWMAGVFLSALFVSFLLFLAILVVAATLFLVWGVPFQWGVPVISLIEFSRAAIVLSYFSFLAVVFHPAVAVLCSVVLQDALFYHLTTWSMAGVQSASASWKPFLAVLQKVVYGLYLVFPSFSAFSSKFSNLVTSFRMTQAEAIPLLQALGYAFVATGFFFLASVLVLRRRRLT